MLRRSFVDNPKTNELEYIGLTLWCNYPLQLCVQNSPQEARNMLLQNPQLAFALLQAQVVMRIVDPEIALVRPGYSQLGSVQMHSSDMGLGVLLTLEHNG